MLQRDTHHIINIRKTKKKQIKERLRNNWRLLKTKLFKTIIEDKRAKLRVGYIRIEAWQGTKKYSFEQV